MELRQVEHFLAVVEHGSFTAAARARRIVQSALSTSIRNLERELGAALFERTTRRVTISEAGRAFLPCARRVVAESTAAAEAVRAVTGLHRGRVAIGMIQWLGPVDLPAELSAFHRRHPDIQLTVLNAPVSTLVERLRDGELDLAYLATDGPLPDDLTGPVIYGEDLLLIMPPEHRLAGRTQVAWTELDGEPFVDFAESTAITGILRRVSGQLGLNRRMVGQVSQLDLQLALVRNGFGLAIVQGTLAESTRGVAVAELVEPRLHWSVSLASRAPGPVNPAAVALLDHLSPTQPPPDQLPRESGIPSG
ncbi:MAG TPA: LysR family transcriptional regulator [Pseudonocardia sp.]|nr:LysR family transcriptional regulator [Pseudonocardia sp.]